MGEALLKLAERCERATGPDRELDVAIWLAAVADEPSLKAYREGRKISRKEADFRADYMMDGARYTASLDAAMTLVPEGMYPNIDCEPGAPEVEIYLVDNPHGAKGISYKTGTPALALCAAALRAKAKEAE